MTSHEYRLDYVQQTAPSSSIVLWTATIPTYEAWDVKAKVIANGRGSTDPAPSPFFKQEFALGVYRTDGDAATGYSQEDTKRAQAYGAAWTASLSRTGNDVTLKASNVIGGVVDWHADTEITKAKTTALSYGADIAPSSIANLWAWYRGDTGIYQDDAGTIVANNGDPVGRWSDLSGNNRHATQTDAGRKPTLRTAVAILNNQNAIDFLDIVDTLLIGSGPGTSFTIVLTYYTRNTASFGRIIQSATANWLIGPRGTASGTGYYANSFSYAPYAINTGIIQVVTQNTSIGTHRVNGVQYANIGSPAAAGTILFGYGGVFGEAADSVLAEVLVYSRVLTSEELGLLEAYKSSRYAISI